ncbi:trypsin-like peptidase domain-containing protein [Streptomyces sp. AK08-02]|uniref:trypsin-like peptidase domain-containing protein n=1 Tax=Streptomyces sp. AK08-02 TaxID=3028654 RepID=UPI0029B9F626|nr:trypsin-like peptidase domain-containing protein [Streptomyces sp. AK08-02]MDX3747373.1 trypsin-like peptidase domain-containing protein [Streptomyces sp. AK08-02]
MRISEPSVQSLFLVAAVNGQQLGSATGFIVVRGEKPFLITNWHVASGRNPETGQPRSNTGATPDTLHIPMLLPPRQDRIEWKSTPYKLLNEDGSAAWLEHRRYGRRVDVVALPLGSLDEGFELHPYQLESDAPRLRSQISDFVNIVGFPFGRTAGGVFAIWTKGAIASEPDVNFEDLPCFLIDARTREGQSGSPVIAYSPGGPTVLSDGSLAGFNGPVTNLLGVYSGRINERSDLGRVWKASVITELIDDGFPGKGTLMP